METKNKEFIIKFIFEELKDNLQINCASRIRYQLAQRNIWLSNEEMKDLYTKLVNYRIKKYGNSVYFTNKPRTKDTLLCNELAEMKGKSR